MVKTALVSTDIELGARVLAILDRAKAGVTVAIWLYMDEFEDWRLVLAGSRFDTVPLREAYGMLREALNPEGITPDKRPTTEIFRRSDPFIKSLRRLFGRTKSVEGMRLGGQMIGDRFVEDSYAYRIR